MGAVLTVGGTVEPSGHPAPLLRAQGIISTPTLGSHFTHELCVPHGQRLCLTNLESPGSLFWHPDQGGTHSLGNPLCPCSSCRVQSLKAPALVQTLPTPSTLSDVCWSLLSLLPPTASKKWPWKWPFLLPSLPTNSAMSSKSSPHVLKIHFTCASLLKYLLRQC